MGHHFTRRGRASVATVILSSTVLAGCSLIDPYVAPSEEISKRYSEERSLAAAMAYAEALRDEYKGALSDQAILNSSIGLALIPVSALAAYYGITGGNSNTIVGLALGGAGAYIGASYLQSEPRQFVYASGVTAVNCAISIMEPFRTAQIILKDEDGSLTSRIRTVEQTANELSIKIKEALPALGDQNVEIIAAQDAVNVARATSADGRAVEVALKSGGGTLFSSVRQIEATVDRAIIDTQPSLSSLVSTLGTALPLRAGQIAPQPKPKEKAQGEVTAPADANDEAELIELRQKLEGDIIAVREIVDLVKDRTPAESLQNCGVDISKSGLTFNIIPDAPISFVDGATQETSTISVRGGTPPYAASWVGTTPPDISATLTPSPNWDETGILTVTETTASPAEGRYSLLIHDAGIGATIIEVNSGNGGGGAVGSVRAEAAPAAAAGTPPDPDVLQLQSLLQQKNINPGRIDGVFGPDTFSAIKTFTNDQSLLETDARAKVPELIRQLGGKPLADSTPVSLPGAAPAPLGGPPLSAEEQTFFSNAFALLATRQCVDNSTVPATMVEAQQKLDQAVLKVQAAHTTLDRLGNEDTLNALQQDSNLTCAGQ